MTKGVYSHSSYCYLRLLVNSEMTHIYAFIKNQSNQQESTTHNQIRESVTLKVSGGHFDNKDTAQLMANDFPPDESVSMMPFLSRTRLQNQSSRALTAAWCCPWLSGKGNQVENPWVISTSLHILWRNTVNKWIYFLNFRLHSSSTLPCRKSRV